MRVVSTEFDGLLVVEPTLYRDARGYLLETWNESRYRAAGMPGLAAQDNLSWSTRGVLRGLHFQQPHPQAKLVYVLAGEIFDVAVDVRHGSSTFSRWFGTHLSAANHRQLYVATGYAHGFCVLSDAALVAYKCSEGYRPDAEMSLLWNDPQVGIEWPVADPSLSAKDAAAKCLSEISLDRLPRFSG